VNADVGQLFVTQVYQTLLNRAPEPAALAMDAGAIDAGTATRLQMSNKSKAARNTAQTKLTNLYQNVLGRAADRRLASSLTFLEQGGTLSQLEAMLPPPMSSSRSKAAARMIYSSTLSTRLP